MAERDPSDQNPLPIYIRPPTFQRCFIAAETNDPDTLVALATDESYFVRRQVVDNPHTPQWILELLVRAGATSDLRGKGEIDPNLDPASLQRLAETGPWGQQLVAEHPNTSAEVLVALKDQPSVPLRQAIATHLHTGAATLAALCCDIDEGVRSKALAHPNRPGDLIELLVSAGSAPDLVGVTKDFGKIIADDFALLSRLGPWGRFLIARHPGCPGILLSQISSDPEWRVRSGLLDNPNTPSNIIQQMLDSPTPEEVETIKSLSQPQISEQNLLRLVMHTSPEVRYALARHPSATSEILGLLSTDGVKEFRRLAADHPKTDPGIIQRLIQAGSTPDLMGLSEPDVTMPSDEIRKLLQGGIWARQLAVRHPNSDADTLARLLCDREPKIREWAAVHPNLDPETKRDLIRAGSGTDFQGIMPPDPALPAETLKKISQLGSWGEWVVANNPYAPEDLLDTLANSDDWQVRSFVAKNPGTSATTLARLEADPVNDVRKSAIDRTR
jgi:hypothetical protein